MIRQRMGRTRLGDTKDVLLIEEVHNGTIRGQVKVPKLPNRRPAITTNLEWNGARYHLCIGFYPDTGRPAEAFLCGAKAGSEMDALLDDACIALSKLMQAGADPAELADTFGGQSIIGAVAKEIAAYA